MLNQGRVLFQHANAFSRSRSPMLLRNYTTSKKSVFKRIVIGAGTVTLATTATVGVAGTLLYYNNDQFRHVTKALDRCRIAGTVGAKVAFDYQRTLSKQYKAEESYEEAKRACHQRCAERVLVAVQRLGGVYVKLGQHISVMQYLLPKEWCQTMRVLQDQCNATSRQDIEKLFMSDYGIAVQDLFEEFDWTPIGVASLAQVHRAKLKEEKDWVAIKIQHPNLDDYCQIDMDTVSFLFEIIKKVFPEFGFEWFAEEMRESLPKELDFVHEAKNAAKVEFNFANDIAHHNTCLVIPKVLWAKRRIMCMEFIVGSRVDDLEYMNKHNIDPKQVSAELTRIFSEMIFLHGFVHCDPHPGNVFIRPAKDSNHSKCNFDLVLLDHGLYRELSEDLRSNYAHLWTSLIKGDEAGIEKYSYRVGGTDVYQLFACMLTGREWEKIEKSDLNSVREIEEMGRISNGAMEYLTQVADILGKLPRTVLLLLKTNDLLRHVDEKLNLVADDRITYVIMGSYCSKAVWLDTKKYILNKIRLTGFTFSLFKQLFVSWWQYESLVYGLWFYQFTTRCTEKLLLIKNKSHA
ncbi:ABC1 family-domain-containing protein [Helicostylum pulchrum]|nr:ABC1 family-domain-containing protein [Helicostylum pulchrum]